VPPCDFLILPRDYNIAKSRQVAQMKKVSILMYHQVGEFNRPKEHRATFCHIRRFKAQMAYLYHLGYKVLQLGDAIDALSGKWDLSGHGVVLTFDDGYQNFRDYAFPVLQRYDFPATVFLVSGLMGKSAKWLADDGRYAPKLMKPLTVKELRENNITFGSHSVSHPRLSQINGARQIQEIADSKSALEDLLGEEIPYFCYPNGDYDNGVVAMVREAGYRAALTCDRGAATASDDPLTLPRKAISFGDSLIGYFWKLHIKNKRKLQDIRKA
jgi:peptidoglycan/xylan/chitin deacetylase (PgdA/CDA1 family)